MVPAALSDPPTTSASGWKTGVTWNLEQCAAMLAQGRLQEAFESDTFGFKP